MSENNMQEPAKTEIELAPELPDELIEDEFVTDLYAEVLNDLREERSEVTEVLANMMDMVFNEGDATTASKEAMVNLFKIRADIADKKSKIAELATRIKIKERDTMNKWLTNQAGPSQAIEEKKPRKKRELLKELDAKEKK